jgi:elongation factor G
MDTLGADFFYAVDQMREMLGANAIPVELPIGKEDTFEGVIDLVQMHAIYYRDDEGKVFDWVEPRFNTVLDDDGNELEVQEHLYAKTLFIGGNDSISNYIEVDEPKED